MSSDVARAVVDGVADLGVFAEATLLDGLDGKAFRADELGIPIGRALAEELRQIADRYGVPFEVCATR